MLYSWGTSLTKILTGQMELLTHLRLVLFFMFCRTISCVVNARTRSKALLDLLITNNTELIADVKVKETVITG